MAGFADALSGKKKVKTRSKDKKADNGGKNGSNENGGGAQISRIPGVLEF